MVGWLERRLGPWQRPWVRLGLVCTLPVPLVVKPQTKFLKKVKDMWSWYGYRNPWGWPGYWGATPYGWPWAPIPKEQEIAMLEEQARMLESELDSIKKRLEELKK
jgi:hypothetical protein